MIQNLLTTLTPLGIKNENNYWENRPFTTVWPDKSQQKTKGITKTIKKKQKRVRTAFSTEQLRALEKTYTHHRYIDSETRAELAKSLNIGDKCIKIWFQNRRMKEKKETSESSCDSSNESVSNETPLEPASPTLQEKLEDQPSEQLNNLSHYNNPEHDYQLPIYYGAHQIPPGYRGIQAPSFATYFYNDTNVYPTQYYPFEVNYSNSEGTGFNQYGCEINNWSSNHYPYYATI